MELNFAELRSQIIAPQTDKGWDAQFPRIDLLSSLPVTYIHPLLQDVVVLPLILFCCLPSLVVNTRISAESVVIYCLQQTILDKFESFNKITEILKDLCLAVVIEL